MNWGGLTGTALADEVRKEQKHCILLWMNGGASQFETFDMKPGRPTGGPFRPIATNVPGIQVCELMPKMAKQMDKVAVIRSMKTSEVDHPGGIYLMHTGYRPSATVRFPEIGAIVAKYQGLEGPTCRTSSRSPPRATPGPDSWGPSTSRSASTPRAACRRSPCPAWSQREGAAPPRIAVVRRGPLRRRDAKRSGEDAP